MSRIVFPMPDDMSEEQRAVYDAAVAGKRGRAPLPLLAWLQSPVFAGRAQSLGEFVRYDTSLGPRLSELAILVVARDWNAPYEWTAHQREALRAGLDERIIAAVAEDSDPIFENDDEALIYQFSRQLLKTRKVEDEVYRCAIAAFGERGIVELVGILGYYSLIAMTLNTFEIVAAPTAS
jgi:4-carboxymuconolactone decarboxylase